MGGEVLTPIDGLSNAILLAPDGIEIALTGDAEVLSNEFVYEETESVVHTLQTLADELHYFHQVDVASLREAVFHLTLLVRGNQKRELGKALQKVAGELRRVPRETFRRAAREVAVSRQMVLFKGKGVARKIGRQVLKKSAGLKEADESLPKGISREELERLETIASLLNGETIPPLVFPPDLEEALAKAHRLLLGNPMREYSVVRQGSESKVNVGDGYSVRADGTMLLPVGFDLHTHPIGFSAMPSYRDMRGARGVRYIFAPQSNSTVEVSSFHLVERQPWSRLCDRLVGIVTFSRWTNEADPRLLFLQKGLVLLWSDDGDGLFTGRVTSAWFPLETLREALQERQPAMTGWSLEGGLAETAVAPDRVFNLRGPDRRDQIVTLAYGELGKRKEHPTVTILFPEASIAAKGAAVEIDPSKIFIFPPE